MYLWQKRGGFFFQVRIPSNRVETLGRGHFRLWLGQIPKREAKRRALLLAAVAFEGFESGMDRETLTKSLKALSDELEFLQKEERKASFARLAAVSRIDDAYNDAADDRGEPDPSLIAHHGEKLASARAKEKTLASVRSRLDTIGQALQTDAAALTAERAAYAHAIATVAAIERAPVVAASLPIAPVVERSEHEDERAVTADTLLSDAGKFYLALRKEAKEGAEGDDRYQERLESVLAAFIDVIGDKPLRHYLPAHVQDFATVMAKVPKNRTKYAFFKGLSLREMSEANKKRKAPIPTLNASSVSSHLSEIVNLWSKATAGVEGIRDLKALKVTMPASVRKKNVREALPAKSLDIWMRDAAAINTVRYDYKRYLPLVGLLTGMRLGEITWLQPKDIVEIDGHTVIDLRLPLKIGRTEVDRRTKTETSPRVVALHPFLKECGFIDWARSRRIWIFGEFHRAKVPADAAGKQMGTWMRKLGIHVEHEQVFHSLRHNAKHWIRNGIAGDTSKLISDRQCGHVSDSVGDNYGYSVLQSDEIAKIEALPLPAKVDFSGFLKR